MSAIADTQIANRALQKLGAKRLSDIDDDSVNGRACKAAWDLVRDSELRKHVWNFAIKRANLSPLDATPSFGRRYQYPLPSDFVRIAPDYEEDNSLDKDWVVEGRYILSDESPSLYLRYVAQISDVSQWDYLFIEAFAAKLAYELCEQLTQSNTKKADLANDYKYAVEEAKRINGIEKRPQVMPDDSWITSRN